MKLKTMIIYVPYIKKEANFAESQNDEGDEVYVFKGNFPFVSFD
jgi:hypothetical protein